MQGSFADNQGSYEHSAEIVLGQGHTRLFCGYPGLFYGCTGLFCRYEMLRRHTHPKRQWAKVEKKLKKV